MRRPDLSRLRRSAVAIAAALLLTGCAPGGAGQNSGAGPILFQTAPALGACRDEGPRLPISGLCEINAQAFIDPAAAPPPSAPPNCDWRIQETAMPAGEILLYRALQCGGVRAQLAFEGGARQGRLFVARSAIGAETSGGTTFATLIGADPARPTENLLSFARSQTRDPVERRRCRVRPANVDGWPADALVVDVDAATAQRADPDQPRAACGPYGLDETTKSFWRVADGVAWFFDLGQDAYTDVDPSTLTLVDLSR